MDFDDDMDLASLSETCIFSQAEMALTFLRRYSEFELSASTLVLLLDQLHRDLVTLETKAAAGTHGWMLYKHLKYSYTFVILELSKVTHQRDEQLETAKLFREFARCQCDLARPLYEIGALDELKHAMYVYVLNMELFRESTYKSVLARLKDYGQIPCFGSPEALLTFLQDSYAAVKRKGEIRVRYIMAQLLNVHVMVQILNNTFRRLNFELTEEISVSTIVRVCRFVFMDTDAWPTLAFFEAGGHNDIVPSLARFVVRQGLLKDASISPNADTQ